MTKINSKDDKQENKEIIKIANKILKEHKKAFEVLGND